MSSQHNTPDISVILHLPKKMPYSLKNFYNVILSVLNQYNNNIELIILNESGDKKVIDKIYEINSTNCIINYISFDNSKLGTELNAAFQKASSENILYINNRNEEVRLKMAATSALLLASNRHPQCGMIYADYEIIRNDQITEIRLLKHHPGRLRDNQDYGCVFLFRKSVIRKCGGFNEDLKFNTLYDIRLKISNTGSLVHLANKTSGSIYGVFSEKSAHNVFDYLMASKESQLEAENVLNEHLKRNNAFLKSGQNYNVLPTKTDKTKLVASVIIPVNNRPEFIGTAIESVLDQTINEIEVIVVVNGGSEDPTINVVQEYMKKGKKYDPKKPEVRLISIDINNIGLSLNLGAKAAYGEYYVQLDSDDRLKLDAVEKIVESFKSDPKIGMVIGSYEVWHLNEKTKKLEKDERIPVVTHDEWTEENGRNNLLRINGAGAPRSIPIHIIKEMGYFSVNDEPYSQNYGEDYEMILKISEKYRIGRIWDPIYEVVRHGGGTDHSINQETIDRNDEAKDYMRLYALLRRTQINQLAAK